jgi:hypothetical protein
MISVITGIKGALKEAGSARMVAVARQMAIVGDSRLMRGWMEHHQKRPKMFEENAPEHHRF